MKKVVIFCPYPKYEAPSQRFRFEQYISTLEEHGFKVTYLSFFNQSAWNTLKRKAGKFRTLGVMIKALLFRGLHIMQAMPADYVFIHRETLPMGPPILEWAISKLFLKKIIYDFDDAIWITDKVRESKFERMIRHRSKVAAICRWSYKISVGNAYLAGYAREFNPNVQINPTTIDTKALHNRGRFDTPHLPDSQRLVIGWTGSYTTLKYLLQAESILQEIETNHPHVYFLVIADEEPKLQVKNFYFKKWKKETEIEDLLLMDIGIMPLPDDAWTQGKCGFKALQYMALEIPPVVSPVGVNTSIINHGVNGYLCKTPKEWINTLEQLIQDADVRKRVGAKARETIVTNYSVASNSSNFLSLFD